MTTSYVFTHKKQQDEHSILHVGKHLVTATEFQERVVQEFENDAAAKAHVDRFIELRKRTGYSVREIEQTLDSIVLPRELSNDPLTKFVFWAEKPPLRLGILLHSKDSPEKHAAIVDRIEREKPSMITIDSSSRTSPKAHFAQQFMGRSLPMVRDLFINQVLPFPLNEHGRQFGSLAHVFDAMPELQRAFFNGEVAFCPIRHSSLVELHLHGDPICSANVEALGTSSLPALHKLEIVLCEEARCACPIEMCAISLSTLDAPNLEWLRVQGLEDIACFLETYLRGGVPSSLHTLRLEGEIPDEDALLAVLTRYGDILRKLRNVSLPLLDEVSLCAVERVKEILPCYVEQSNVSSRYPESVYLSW